MYWMYFSILQSFKIIYIMKLVIDRGLSILFNTLKYWLKCCATHWNTASPPLNIVHLRFITLNIIYLHSTTSEYCLSMFHHHWILSTCAPPPLNIVYLCFITLNIVYLRFTLRSTPFHNNIPPPQISHFISHFSPESQVDAHMLGVGHSKRYFDVEFDLRQFQLHLMHCEQKYFFNLSYEYQDLSSIMEILDFFTNLIQIELNWI